MPDLVDQRDAAALDLRRGAPDRVQHARAAVREVLQHGDVVGDRDVTRAPGEPRRHLHLGTLRAVRLEQPGEGAALRLDGAAAADAHRGRADLVADPGELGAALRGQPPAAARCEHGEADEPPRVAQRQHVRAAAPERDRRAGRGGEGRPGDERAFITAESAERLDRFVRQPEARALFGIDRVRLDRVQGPDPAFVEQERRRCVLGQVEGAFGVREQDPGELGVRGRGRDRRDRCVRRFRAPLEIPILRAERARERRDAEVQPAPGKTVDDVLERHARPQHPDLDDDGRAHGREIQEIGHPERDGAEDDRPEQHGRDERVVAAEQGDREGEREEFRHRAGGGRDLAARAAGEELLERSRDRERDADRERARRDLRSGHVRLKGDADEEERGDREHDARSQVQRRERAFGLRHDARPPISPLLSPRPVR